MSIVSCRGGPSALSLEFRHLIGGELEDSDAHFEVVDPSTGMPFARCPDASLDQLDRAVIAAQTAQRSWRATRLEERQSYIGQLSRALLTNQDELSMLLVMEQGKPLTDAIAEIQRAAGSMHEICSVDLGSEIISDDVRGRAELYYRPLGVIGAITPWNAPIVLAAPKIASALYAGNAIILKPSPFTPLTTLRLGEIVRDLLPHGLLGILAGGDDIGRAMARHPLINKISFTGSVAAGKDVMACGAASLKRLTLELGGNDAAIVLEDAAIAKIAPRLFKGAFTISGQVCMAIKRLYVPRSRYQEVVAHMSRLANSAKVGNGFEEGVEIGPVQNREQFARVMELIADTRTRADAEITAGGYALDRPGYFIAPTIVAGLSEGVPLVDQEQFGPVLPILAYDTVDEVVGRANNSSFGLGGSVWSANPARAAELAARLEVGFTWVNHHVGTTRNLPFGGMKQSGIGRQGHAIGVKSDMEAQVVFLPAGSSPAQESAVHA